MGKKIIDIKMRCDASQGRKSKTGGKSKATEWYKPWLNCCDGSWMGDNFSYLVILRVFSMVSRKDKIPLIVLMLLCTPVFCLFLFFFLFFSFFLFLFSRVHATLDSALSVCPLVCLCVSPSHCFLKLFKSFNSILGVWIKSVEVFCRIYTLLVRNLFLFLFPLKPSNMPPSLPSSGATCCNIIKRPAK